MIAAEEWPPPFYLAPGPGGHGPPGRGARVVKERFGVDEDVCTGDHACMRLSGCPSLSVKKLDDPLRDDPRFQAMVATAEARLATAGDSSVPPAPH